MRMDTVRRGSPILELKRSGTSLLHAKGHRYAWFPLVGAQNNMNSLLHANEHGFAWFPLFGAEMKLTNLVACE